MIDFLIVEDNDSKYTEVKKAILSVNSDFDIHRVEDVKSATDQIKKRQFCFVIVDMQLPNSPEDKDTINSKGGYDLVKWVKHNQKKKKCQPPENILILSQFAETLDAYNDKLLKTRVFTYLYKANDDVWINEIQDIIEEYLIQNESKTNKTSDDLIVYSVHGINTNGEWQSEFGGYLENRFGDNVKYINYKYQYYPVYSFLNPFLRKKEVDILIGDLKHCAKSAPNATVHLIGHSFGTYLISTALERLTLESAPKIGNIILVNSVLKSDYNWSKTVTTHNIKKILNECCINDKILILSQLFAMGLGMAGRLGFKGNLFNTVTNRYFKGGHSDLLQNKYFDDWCLHISNQEVISINEREEVNFKIAFKNSILLAGPYLILAGIITAIAATVI